MQQDSRVALPGGLSIVDLSGAEGNSSEPEPFVVEVWRPVELSANVKVVSVDTLAVLLVIDVIFSVMLVGSPSTVLWLLLDEGVYVVSPAAVVLDVDEGVYIVSPAMVVPAVDVDVDVDVV